LVSAADPSPFTTRLAYVTFCTWQSECFWWCKNFKKKIIFFQKSNRKYEVLRYGIPSLMIDEKWTPFLMRSSRQFLSKAFFFGTADRAMHL
jgi:hypothetical protein